MTTKKKPQLNQIIALVKGKKSKLTSKLTDTYKQIQRSELFSGLEKTYQPIDEEGEALPPDSKKVSKSVPDLIDDLKETVVDCWDLILTQDSANSIAESTIELDRIILSHIPVTTLIFLEKQLTDIITFIGKLPTLSDSDEWEVDPNNNRLFRTNVVKTHRTKKVSKPVVLYDATEHHPAQCEMTSEDVLAGYWLTSKRSGAISENKKREWLNNAESLKDAVIKARESANSIEVEQQKMGETIFNYIFS